MVLSRMLPRAALLLAMTLVILPVAPARAVELKVDFGVADEVVGGPFPTSTPNDVQVGFFDFSADQNAWDDDGEIANLPISGISRVVAGVTVSISGGGSASGVFMIDMFAEQPGSLGDLLEEAAAGSGGDLLVRMSALPAATYQVTTYHHLAQLEIGYLGPFDIFVDAGSGEVSAANDLQPTDGSASRPDLASASFQVTANGVDDVVLRVHTDDTFFPTPFLNGFTLVPVPEPSSWMLLAMATLGIGLHRWRRCRRAVAAF